MQASTRILITGANGFVGQACVAEARARGITVIALHRSAAPWDWAKDSGIVAVQADLSDPSCVAVIQTHLPHTCAVIHAAAHLGGDADTHASDTVNATQNLLDAMLAFDARLVLVSSIAVYDTQRLNPFEALTESSPLETVLNARDAYSRAKLLQEQMCQKTDLPLWLMRPGAVYGKDRTWHALMGFWASKLHVQLDGGGSLPMVHVAHLARALVQAALTDPAGTQALNVIDDDLPGRARYLAAHRKAAGWPRLALPMPYGLWMTLARVLRPVSTRLPGLLREPVLRARLMPLHYPNDALRAALGGQDTAPFETMLAQSLEGTP